MAGRGPRPDPTKPFSRYTREGRATQRTQLPAEGNPLPPPELPTGRAWSDAERALWEEAWGSPQSTKWDLSMCGVVALYVAALGQMLTGRLTAGLVAEVRQLAEQLGLTPEGMRRLGWEIAEPGDVAPIVSLAPAS